MADSLLILESFNFTLESLKFAEAERSYQESLSGVGTRREEPKATKPPPATSTTESTGGGLSSLAQQVAKAREHIQNSLQNPKSASTPPSSSGGAVEDPEMREENALLKKKLENLENQVKQLTDRVTKLERSSGSGDNRTSSAPVVPEQKSAGDTPAKKEAEEDDDVDLFGSDEEDDGGEAAKVKEARLAEYAAKKSKKPALIAKSNVILDVKPWDDETDMKKLEEVVRTISMEGLLWGSSKLVPLAYGIQKLQISTVVVDDKVSIDELTEKIESFEDFVQSVDIAAFNKI